MPETLGALGGLAGLVALLTVIVRASSSARDSAFRELKEVLASTKEELRRTQEQRDAIAKTLAEAERSAHASEREKTAMRAELSAHAHALAEANERIAAHTKEIEELKAERAQARDALLNELLKATERRGIQ